MQGEMDKTDWHFCIDYDDDVKLFRAIQFDLKIPENWAIAEESNSVEDLIERCHESGLKHYVGLKRSAIEEILQWLRDRPALGYVEKLWEEDSNLTKKVPIGFRPPEIVGRGSSAQ